MDFAEVIVDRDGWLRIDELRVRVRFVESAERRLVPVGVEAARGVLTVRMLQQIPFGRVEAAANASVVAAIVRKRINKPGEYRATVVVFREADPPKDYHGPNVIDLSGVRALDRVEQGLARFGPYGDDFYRDFAETYEAEAVRSDRPAAVLAEELDVSTTRIWRWVRVCRARAFLAPSRSRKEEV